MLGSLNVLEGARAAGTPQGRVRLERRHDLRRRRPRRPAGQGVAPAAARSRPTAWPRGSVTDYLHAYRELHQLEFTSLALANVYGPRQDPHGEAGRGGDLRRAAPRRASRARSSATASRHRDFVYVDDVVDAFVRAADEGSGLLVQHRHRRRDVGERALRDDGGRGRRRRAPPLHAPARPGELARSRARPGPGRSSTSAGSRGPTCRPASPRSSTGSGRAGRSASGRGPPSGRRTISSWTSPRRSQPGPRLARRRRGRRWPCPSPARRRAASSSTTHTSVTCSSRPERVLGAPEVDDGLRCRRSRWRRR